VLALTQAPLATCHVCSINNRATLQHRDDTLGRGAVQTECNSQVIARLMVPSRSEL
jgi:hypothetical protein